MVQVMEGYRVILSKKINLYDFCDNQSGPSDDIEESSVSNNLLNITDLTESDESLASNDALRDECINITSGEVDDNDVLLPQAIQECDANSTELIVITDEEDNAIDSPVNARTLLKPTDANNKPICYLDNCTEELLRDQQEYLDVRKAPEKRKTIEMPDDIKFPNNTCVAIVFIYICPKCKLECETADGWIQHITVEHMFNTLEGLCIETTTDAQGRVLCLTCKLCHQIFSETVPGSRLLYHHFFHLPSPYFLRCRFCIFITQCAKDATVHARKKHFEAQENNSESDLMQRIPCPICTTQSITEKNWRFHLLNKHSYCEITNAFFDHGESNSYVCKICDLHVNEGFTVNHLIIHKNLDGMTSNS